MWHESAQDALFNLVPNIFLSIPHVLKEMKSLNAKNQYMPILKFLKRVHHQIEQILNDSPLAT